MSWLRKLLRTTHRRHTHQRFALDACAEVTSPAGQRLVRLLLRHHRRYLQGALAPDLRIRDFHNHVVHAGDGYWGGGPAKATRWHDWMQDQLAHRAWSDAAHTAGILSHYFTDMLQPLHTDHSDREQLIHRPFEYSVAKAYDLVFRRWQQNANQVRFELAAGDGWLAAAMLQSARLAHREFQPIVDGYQLEMAVDDPPAGLNEAACRRLADLFGVAITGWARILERIAAEAESRAGHPLPTGQLVGPFGQAVLQAPFRRFSDWIDDRHEAKAVAELFAEYLQHGRLRHHAPEETVVIRRVIQVHRQEQARQQQAAREKTAGQKTAQGPATAPPPARAA